MESFLDFWGISRTGWLSPMQNPALVTVIFWWKYQITVQDVELKYAQDGDMYIACEKALQQIEDKNYTARLKEDGMQNIIKYGIACYKKNCKVILN